MQTKLRVRQWSLDQWLGCVLEHRGEDLSELGYWFPSAALLDEYLATVGERPEAEVLTLIERLLMPSCALGIDVRRQQNLSEGTEMIMGLQYWRRLSRWASAQQRGSPPWEGLTWVIDLLPLSPALALEVIDAYVLVHLDELPEGRIAGLDDARRIIRARFIDANRGDAVGLARLRGLPPRQFERLVAHLYVCMGYEVELTAATRDGGRDLVATRRELGVAECLFVEVKRVTQVGVEIPRALLGVVTAERANKGVVVTSGTISGPARAFMRTNNMEGVDGVELAGLLAAHCGHGWPSRLAAMLASAPRTRRG